MFARATRSLESDFLIEFHGVWRHAVIKIAMRKSSAVAKRTLSPLSRKKRSVVKEDEQLYLVRRSANASTNGFRHHRPKDKRRDEVAAEQFDPAKAILDFSDNER